MIVHYQTLSTPIVMTTPPANAPRLAARALTKTYGAVTALDHLDLEIGAGDVYCLLGANGAGKTTLTAAVQRALQDPA